MQSSVEPLRNLFRIWQRTCLKAVLVKIGYYLEYRHFAAYHLFDERSHIFSRTITHLSDVFNHEGFLRMIWTGLIPVLAVVPKFARSGHIRTQSGNEHPSDQGKCRSDARQIAVSAAIEDREEFIRTVLDCLERTASPRISGKDCSHQFPPSNAFHGRPLNLVPKDGTIVGGMTGGHQERHPPFKALLCTHNLNWEGASLYLYDVTKGLQRRGIIDATILSPRKGPITSLYEKAGIHVEVCDRVISNTYQYQEWLTGFRGLVDRLHVEVIFANTALNWHVVRASRELGVPCLWNIHESEGPDLFFMSLPPEVIREASSDISLPDLMVYGSHSTAYVWESLRLQQRSAVIHNALDSDDFVRKASMQTREEARSYLQLSDDAICLLMVGTVCPRKGQQDLVNAVKRLPDRIIRRLRCFIIGDWTHPYALAMQGSISREPDAIKRAITCVDVTENIHLYLSAADVAVCSSRSECFPRTILEYMAYGLPIISTLEFGLSEQIFQGINGLVYEPGAIHDLTEHIRSLFDDRELRRQLGANSLKVFRCLNQYEDMLDRYASAFEGAFLSSRLAM